MKNLNLSRVAPLALIVAVSLALNLAVVQAISAQGMKAIVALKASQPVA